MSELSDEVSAAGRGPESRGTVRAGRMHGHVGVRVPASVSSRAAQVDVNGRNRRSLETQGGGSEAVGV